MTKPVRIVYLINSMEGGGAQTPLPQIIGALRKGGAEVRVLALTKRNGKAIEALRGANLEPLVRDGGETDHLAALRWTVRNARDLNAQVIWTSLTRATLIGQIAAARLGIPVISWQHNMYLKPWNERLLRWRASSSDLWIADSSKVAELTRDRLRLPDDKMMTWPIFAVRENPPLSCGYSKGETVRIGSLGRLHRNKGYDYLISALALLKDRAIDLPPFHCTIGGVGTERENLDDQAKRLGVSNLSFSGFIDDPLQFLSRQHLYVQPSRREGFCIAAHEAMQAQLPIIASRVGEMEVTIDRDFGRLVDIGDVDGLADALQDFLARPEQLNAKGRIARSKVVHKFSQAKFDDTGLTIMQRLRTLIYDSA